MKWQMWTRRDLAPLHLYLREEPLCVTPKYSLVQLDLWVSLIKLICKLLCVGVIITQCNEVNLQLKWAICFVSQCKTNTVYLKTQKQHLDLLLIVKNIILFQVK